MRRQSVRLSMVMERYSVCGCVTGDFVNNVTGRVGGLVGVYIHLDTDYNSPVTLFLIH